MDKEIGAGNVVGGHGGAADQGDDPNEAPDIDLDDFLRQGGIDLEEME